MKTLTIALTIALTSVNAYADNTQTDGFGYIITPLYERMPSLKDRTDDAAAIEYNRKQPAKIHI